MWVIVIGKCVHPENGSIHITYAISIWQPVVTRRWECPPRNVTPIRLIDSGSVLDSSVLHVQCRLLNIPFGHVAQCCCPLCSAKSRPPLCGVTNLRCTAFQFQLIHIHSIKVCCGRFLPARATVSHFLCGRSSHEVVCVDLTTRP